MRFPGTNAAITPDAYSERLLDAINDVFIIADAARTWLFTPHADLDWRTPHGAIDMGEEDRVIELMTRLLDDDPAPRSEPR